DRTGPAPVTSGPEPGAAAGGAALRDFGLDGALGAFGRILQRDLDRVLDVLAAGGRPLARSPQVEPAPAALSAEEGLEEVAEVLELGGAGTAGLAMVLAGDILVADGAAPGRRSLGAI